MGKGVLWYPLKCSSKKNTESTHMGVSKGEGGGR